MMNDGDTTRVLEMMGALWPDFDGNHDFGHNKVFVWEESGALHGFASFSVRPWVDGAEHAPVPHLEGWFVEPAERRKGKGVALVRAVEEWCVQNGFKELTSDTLLDNVLSIVAHKAIGFAPTEQIQYFRKGL